MTSFPTPVALGTDQARTRLHELTTRPWWKDVSLPLNRTWPVPEITPVASRDDLDLVGES